jgi:hypothetical protein
VAAEGEERGVFFAHAVQNPDGALLSVGEADDFASRAAQLALQLDDARRWVVKVLLEEGVENVHGCGLLA